MIPDTQPSADTAASVTSLAEPQSRLERILGYVPRALSSKAHVIFLIALGIYLVLIPLFGVAVSAKAELIGGNYTNVTSDVGACIAAGGTLHLIRQGRRRHRLEEERLRLTREMHVLLGRAHPELLAEMHPTGEDEGEGRGPLPA